MNEFKSSDLKNHTKYRCVNDGPFQIARRFKIKTELDKRDEMRREKFSEQFEAFEKTHTSKWDDPSFMIDRAFAASLRKQGLIL